MSATGRRAQDGFTIIECLAVLAITALASAIAFPSMERALKAGRLAQSTQALMSDLSWSRGHALSSGQPETLVIGEDAQSYRWNSEAPRLLPAGEQLQLDHGRQISFSPDGSASPGQLMLIAGQRHTSITVSETGVIALDRSHPPGSAR